MAGAMASKNLSRCAEVSFNTKLSKTLLGIEALRFPKGAWVWQRYMRPCWTRRSPVASAQVMKRLEVNATVEKKSSREPIKSITTGMLDLNFRIGNVPNVPKASLQRGRRFPRRAVLGEEYQLSSADTSQAAVASIPCDCGKVRGPIMDHLRLKLNFREVKLLEIFSVNFC